MYGMVGYKLCFFGTFILQRKEREGERDRQTEREREKALYKQQKSVSHSSGCWEVQNQGAG